LILADQSDTGGLCALPDNRLIEKAFVNSAMLAVKVQSWIPIFKTQIQSLITPWEGLQSIDTGHIRK
jgi:hypothetical protein